MDITVVLSAVAGLSWLLVIGLLAMTVLRASRHQNVKGATTGVIVAVVLALVMSTVSAGLVFVNPQERGVVISAIQKGIRQEALQPGLNWVVPYFENVIMYPISRQTYTMSIAFSEGQIAGDDSVEARTSDGQVVLVDASIIFAIDPSRVVDIHIMWQDQYINNLVRPQSRGVIRDAVSQFGIEEVYSSKRLDLTQQMSAAMAETMKEGGLILVDFVLRNITFSDEYAASVEQKQIAEQLAQQAKFVVEQRKQEAEQARQTAAGLADAAVIRAQGEADSLLINAAALAQARVIQATAEAEALQLIADVLLENPDLLTYQYIDKLSPGIRVMLVPNDTPYMLPLPDLETLEQPVSIPAPVESP
ncbi:MAG: prohibitin family protein [Chloroflexi bacterium]|nr:prohibitin family protein [Chloroflexota bacterium]